MSKKKIESAVDDILRKSKWSGVKDQGISILEESVKAKAESLIARLFTYGIAIVPVGELESWIPLEQTKSRWIEPALKCIYGKTTPEPLKDFVTKLLAPL
jgi:hypothetical protein